MTTPAGNQDLDPRYVAFPFRMELSCESQCSNTRIKQPGLSQIRRERGLTTSASDDSTLVPFPKKEIS